MKIKLTLRLKRNNFELINYGNGGKKRKGGERERDPLFTVLIFFVIISKLIKNDMETIDTIRSLKVKID